MVFGFGAPCPKIHTTFLFSKHVSKVFENIFKIKLKVKKRSELHTFTVHQKRYRSKRYHQKTVQ